MLRVAGEVEFIQDEELKSKLIEERPFLKDAIAQFGDDILEIFRIAIGKAHFWTMADNLREDEVEVIEF